MRLNGLKLLGLIIWIFLFSSCEKISNSTDLIGTWDFYMNCNKICYRGCIFYFNRDFTETIVISDDMITRYFDDTVFYTSTYRIIDTLIVYGQNQRYAQEFILRNDTLTLIDTCLACDYNVYVRK